MSVPGFGDTYSVERRSGGLITFPYFDGFVDYFVRRGYERGKSIRAAPYDWRLGPGVVITACYALLILLHSLEILDFSTFQISWLNNDMLKNFQYCTSIPHLWLAYILIS